MTYLNAVVDNHEKLDN